MVSHYWKVLNTHVCLICSIKKNPVEWSEQKCCYSSTPNKLSQDSSRLCCRNNPTQSSFIEERLPGGTPHTLLYPLFALPSTVYHQALCQGLDIQAYVPALMKVTKFMTNYNPLKPFVKRLQNSRDKLVTIFISPMFDFLPNLLNLIDLIIYPCQHHSRLNI